MIKRSVSWRSEGVAGASTYAVVRVRKKKREKRSPISGGHSEGDPPVPIPNTEVKPFSADNTRLETSWEDKTLPESNIQEAEKPMRLVRFLILYMQGEGIR